MMMNFIDDEMGAASRDALVWRFDKLLSLLFDGPSLKGHIDFDKMVWLMSFLSPARSPGYWNNRIDPKDPLSAIVEGSTSVFDCGSKRVSTLTGYFHDRWMNITLMNYVE